MKTISLLGCGWLGLPLAKALSFRQWQVKGSTTSLNKINLLQEASIDPYLITLDPELSEGEKEGFFDSEIFFINIPPGIRKGGGDAHELQVSSLIKRLTGSPVNDIIYVSATSVYPDLNREVSEEDETNPNHILTKTEDLFRAFSEATGKRLTILRYGGLLGYERIPVKYISGKKGQTRGEIPVNFIHNDDAVGVALHLIENAIFGETFNLVAPIHPTREEIMLDCSKRTVYEMPEFIKPSEPEPFKIISADKFMKASGYKFKYPDPLDFEYNKE